MKILWVKANKLLPLHSGGDIRSYHIARHLASRHELSFFSYYDGAPDTEYEARLGEEFSGACSVCTGKSQSVGARALDYVLRVADPVPYAVSRFKSPIVQKKLHELLSQQHFDVAICDFLDAVINFPPSSLTPTVLFQHNVESEIWRRQAETEKNVVKRSIYSVEFRKMLDYEKSMVQKFQHVIAVSEHDRQLMSAWMDASRISVVPTGVDLRNYQPVAPNQPTPEEQSLVLFTGAMDWEPNIDAVEYFCQEIWPSVLTELPEARFRIVGRNPDRRVMRFTGGSVEVTGRVPSVIEHLREAAVVVVPLRIGGGTRLKIYEAMAAGKAVVSTSVGAEGLDVHHGRDIVLADSPQAVADWTVKLLKDRELRKSYERSAAELASGYDWPAVGEKFETLLEKISGLETRWPAQRFATAAAQPVDGPTV